MTKEKYVRKIHLNVPDNSQLRVQLRDHQVFTTEQAEGLVLECLRGGVWVTFDGDYADHFLQPGERFAVAGRGHAVIQALEDSEIALIPKRQDLPESIGRQIPLVSQGTKATREAVPAHRSSLAECATDCWRNVIASFSAARLGLERTF